MCWQHRWRWQLSTCANTAADTNDTVALINVKVFREEFRRSLAGRFVRQARVGFLREPRFDRSHDAFFIQATVS